MSRETPEIAESGGKYVKFWDTPVKLRVLTWITVARSDWDKSGEKSKEYLTQEKQSPLNPWDEKNQPKQVRLIWVYNHTEKKVQLWNVSQVSIMKELKRLSKDEDFGDPREYDIKVTKVVSSSKTEYKVDWLWKGALSTEAQTVVDAKPIFPENAIGDWDIWEEKF